jgi:hypothetical protein
MNSFAIIFGHCVWIPPSPKAAMVALSLFFGIGINTEPDIVAGEAVLAGQYVRPARLKSRRKKRSPHSTPALQATRCPPKTKITPGMQIRRSSGTR